MVQAYGDQDELSEKFLRQNLFSALCVASDFLQWFQEGFGLNASISDPKT